MGRFLTEKAFSLIEVIIVIVLVGGLVGGFSWCLKEYIDVWRMVNYRSEMVNEARLGLWQMARNIRQVKPDTPEEEGLEIADRDCIQFIILSADGNETRIRYRYHNSQIFYDLDKDGDGIFEHSNVLIKEVDSFHFSYYNIDEQELTNFPLSSEERAEVILVRMEIGWKKGKQNLRFKEAVFLRNRRGG